MNLRRTTTRLFLMKDGKFPVLGCCHVGHTPHTGILPGGGVEYGEFPKTAAIREAKEELGVDVKHLHFLKTVITNSVAYHFYVSNYGYGWTGTPAIQKEEVKNFHPDILWTTPETCLADVYDAGWGHGLALSEGLKALKQSLICAA